MKGRINDGRILILDELSLLKMLAFCVSEGVLQPY